MTKITSSPLWNFFRIKRKASDTSDIEAHAALMVRMNALSVQVEEINQTLKMYLPKVKYNTTRSNNE